ncbi:MAG: methyltransferase domain-containing protein [Bdellovibrionales bacterium]
MKTLLSKNIALGWNLGRTAHFAVQQQILPLIESLVTGEKRWQPENLKEKRQVLLKATYDLLKRDSENIANGIYPIEVLKPERPWRHGWRLTRILVDALGVSSRKRRREHKKFSPDAEERLADAPEYYRRNFHFQTDGYLSETSAELYDHQVDILFSGATDAMRRALLPPLKRYLPKSAKLLEIGCGTGRLTHFVSLTMPQATITAVDPSEPYLAAARRVNPGAKNIKFVQGFAEEKHFKENTFDGVYSSFVLHELPRSVRRGLLKEMIKAVKPGGIIAFLDSIQAGDRKEFDWALSRFPKDFHEPFYADYSKDKMENWPAEFPELELRESSTHLLSKLIVFRKLK